MPPLNSALRTAVLLAGLCASTATASEGPWTTAPGLHNVYVGLYGERFECFTFPGDQNPECGEDAAAVPAAVRRVGAKLFYRTGLTRTLDVAVAAPVIRAFASDASDPALQTSTGVGMVQARVRWRMGSLGPLDVSSGAGVESGALHRSVRGRITNLGDGVTSALGTLYAGSTGLLGRRFYTASGDLSYALRLPEVDSDIGRLPGDELRFSSVFLFGLSSRIGLGASADGQVRLWGEPLDFASLSVYGSSDDSLRWAVLDASQLKVGGRIVLYPTGQQPYLQLAGYRSVWARHNPIDTTLIEVAAGFDIGERR